MRSRPGCLVKDLATAIIIVSYRTPADVAECLRALDDLEAGHEVGVFIVENGGREAFQELACKLATFCQVIEPLGTGRRHLRCQGYRLPASRRRVAVAEGHGNLGYAGGVNSWLERHADMQRWTGFWILNPDTAPDPRALTALIEACERSGGGMAGSTMLDFTDRKRIISRGLRWRPWLGSVFGVDYGRSLSIPIPKPMATIDAPNGASIYVTKRGLEKIGFMNEDYFLYFEDVDWGMRAKASGLLCRADESFVPHKRGTALGSAERRIDRSKLSVFLDARNTLLFTSRHDPWFTICAVVRLLLRAVEYLVVGSRQNCQACLQGLAAGLRGDTGRPL